MLITATAKEGGINPNSDTYNVAVCPAVSGVDIMLNGTKVTKQNIGVDMLKGYNGGKLDLDFEIQGNNKENV